MTNLVTKYCTWYKSTMTPRNPAEAQLTWICDAIAR